MARTKPQDTVTSKGLRLAERDIDALMIRVEKLESELAIIKAKLPSKLEWLSTPPSSATDPGTPGQMAYDSGGGTLYLYICTANKTWDRVEIAW